MESSGDQSRKNWNGRSKRKKRRRRKEVREKETKERIKEEEKTKEGKDNGSEEDGKRIENLGQKEESSEVGERSQEIGSFKVL